jgi:hypothetical protein
VKPHAAFRAFRNALLLAMCLLSIGLCIAADTPAERTFHVSKAAVQTALHAIQSYPGGKLPALEGFADPSNRALDDYKRAYYEYAVQLKANGAEDTTVHVTAKITAWYAGTSPASSGYRVLKSSGRLESDLLDALDDRLNPHKEAKPLAAATSAAKLPDSPSVGASASLFETPRLTTAPSSTRRTAPQVYDPATAKKIEALTKQEQALEQIVHGQVRPNNLAVVKRSNTSVLAEPQDRAEVLFQADAEDEFEVLDASADWVHIKISDLSRGWIKRDYVDLPGAATLSVSTLAADAQETSPVRETKQQVGTFPGKWDALDGKQVKIVWVQPHNNNQFGSEPKWGAAKSVFRSVDAGGPSDALQIAGVVVIFDAEDGGMAATTLANLQQWRAGHLSDEAFWKRCWRDPADSFQAQTR